MHRLKPGVFQQGQEFCQPFLTPVGLAFGICLAVGGLPCLSKVGRALRAANAELHFFECGILAGQVVGYLAALTFKTQSQGTQVHLSVVALQPATGRPLTGKNCLGLSAMFEELQTCPPSTMNAAEATKPCSLSLGNSTMCCTTSRWPSEGRPKTPVFGFN